MNAKRCFVALLSAVALMPCWVKLDAETLIFFFSGDITSRRATNSVFTDPNTDQFYGYFSYDTTATAGRYGPYPLISFSVDGNSLVSTNGPFLPGNTGISVNNNGLAGPWDILKIQGFYSPAVALGYDNGSIIISFIDHSGQVFTNNNLPASLSLSSFDTAYLQSPGEYLLPPPGPTYDRGTITQLIQVPEPTACALLGLGLAIAIFTKRRQI